MEGKKNVKRIVGLAAAVVALCVLAAVAVFLFGGDKPAGGDNDAIVAQQNDLVIDLAGTYKGEYDRVTVNSDGAVLENMTADEITISASVGDGDVTLRSVTAKNVYVYGGGDHSVHIESSDIESMISDKKDSQVRIVVDEKTTIGQTTLKNHTKLELNGTIRKLEVESQSEITIQGKVDAMHVSAEAVSSQIQIDGQVEKMD